MNRSETISLLTKALVASQLELKNPPFDAHNTYFEQNYATLASVRDTITPCLASHGLAVTQHLSVTETGVSCETLLIHESGEWIGSTLELPCAKKNAQSVGSTATYARRYALMALVCVVGDDDDDGAATQMTSAERRERGSLPAGQKAPKSADDLAELLQGAKTPNDLIAAWRVCIQDFPHLQEQDVKRLTALKDQLKACVKEAAVA